MMMRLMAILLLGLFAVQASAAGLFARVDRTQLSIDETLELTLETQGGAAFGKPDLEPLEQLFEIFDTRQVNRLSSSNGEAMASTRWLITLRPRQTGYVVIPPLQVADWRSEPITVLVQESLKDTESDQLAPIFIDASVDQESVYVQAQVILTLRIYHSVSLYDDSTLSPLQMPEALVERLGEPRMYEKTINGIRHGVIEVRYALFPQKSGELTIPAQLFSATTVTNGSNSVFGSHGGRSTQVRSPSIPLTVKAKPVDYPAGAPWLPARSLTLVEAWSPEPQQAQVGESLTRSLLLKAEGLTSTQLPAIGSPQNAELRRYPDQPSLANEVSAAGLVGSREQREALIPTRSGPLQLPALEVVWWNTVEDRLERTTLEARTLDVADNPNLAPPATEPPPPPSGAAAGAVGIDGGAGRCLALAAEHSSAGAHDADRLRAVAACAPAACGAACVATRPYPTQPARRSAPRLPGQRFAGHPPGTGRLGAAAAGNAGGHGGAFRAAVRRAGWPEWRVVQRSRPTLAGRCAVAGDPDPTTGQQSESRSGTGRIAAALSTLMAVYRRPW